MSTSSRQDLDNSTRGSWAYGVGAFAGVILATVGLFQFLEGLSAVFEDKVYLTTPDYLYSIDLTGWGWIHMVLGALAMAVGIAVLYGRAWAQATGIVIAVLSAASNFAFLPYYPFWSMMVIAIDVLAIWALATLLRNP
jgi:hypothetical protein